MSAGDPTDPVEVYCNRVASSFLLPHNELVALRAADAGDVEAWARTIAGFARSRNVSSSMVAYRLHRDSAIDKETWLALQGLFRSRWLAARKHERQRLAERDSRPAYGVLVRHWLGSRLIDLTFRLEASGSLTATKVGRVLGVNPRNAHTILPAG